MSRKRSPMPPSPLRPPKTLARGTIAGRAVTVVGFSADEGGQLLLCRSADGFGGLFRPSQVALERTEP